MRLFLFISFIISVNSFYLKAGPGHSSTRAVILTDPIEGPYHIFLVNRNGHHICSVGASGSTILFTDTVCTDVTLELGNHWVFGIDHKDHPYGTIIVELLLADGHTVSEEIKGYCPETKNEGSCLNGMEHTHVRNGESVFPYIGGIVGVIALGLIICYY
jgi:hypothetical protein